MIRISTLIVVSFLLFASSMAAATTICGTTFPTTDTTIHIRVDVPAQFPGGETKWNEYVKSKIKDNFNTIIDDPASRGTCTLQFVVNADGSISNVVVLNMLHTELARIFIKAIKKGSKWIPAQLNGENVRSLMTQKVTFLTK